MGNWSPKHIVLILGAVVMTAGLTRLGGQERAELELVRTDAVSVSEIVARYIHVPPHCDAEGNSYFRFTPVLAQRNEPVTKISPTGRVVTRFRLDSVPNTGLSIGAAIRDFAVDNRERVHLLVSKDAKAFIVVFSADGVFEDTVELIQPSFFPTKMVIFSSGTYLVSGVLQTDSAGPATGRLFSAIFDDTGKLVKEIILPPSSSSEERIPISAAPGGRAGEPEGISYAKISAAASARQAVAGDDDNAYLIPRISPLMVYVLASDGTLVRNLKLTAPVEGLVPLAPAEASGMLLVPFAKLPDTNSGGYELTEFAVYDAGTGEYLVKYRPSRVLDGYLVCYSPGSFTFFAGASNGQPILIHAVPR